MVVGLMVVKGSGWGEWAGYLKALLVPSLFRLFSLHGIFRRVKGQL